MKENDSLNYSTDALNVKSLFYNKEISLYIEGKEDIPFWENILSFWELNNLHLEETYGYEGLIDYMDQIVDNDANILVACDSDHSRFLKENKYKNPKIIRTYGYSIENTMYCVHKINQVVKRFSKSKNSFNKEITKWYHQFCDDCTILLYYDIANHRFSKGVQVFGDKCNRFLESDHSPNLGKDKIDNYIKSIDRHFSEIEINECIELVKKDKRELRFLIKGHFLTNAVINLIKSLVEKETGDKVTLSLDNLYSLMVGCMFPCKDKCMDLETLKERMLGGLAAVLN
jgi:hypothetical protein